MSSLLPVDPPMVTQDPENQSVSTGAEAITFKIEATGDELTFQWQKNGSDLHSGSSYSGINTNTLKIQQVKKSDAGHYRCLVKNRVVRDGKLSKETKLSVCKFHTVKYIVLSSSVGKSMASHVPDCHLDKSLRLYFESALEMLRKVEAY